MEDLHNLMLGADVDTWSTVADGSYIGQAALSSSTDWASLLGGANDDAGVSPSRIAPHNALKLYMTLPVGVNGFVEDS